MDGLTFPGDCLKDPENINSGFIPQAQPYYYFTDDGKAYYALKVPSTDGQKLVVKKQAFDYKVEGNKLTIGKLELNFQLNGKNVVFAGVAGKPVISAVKVETPTGAEIVAADPIN